MPRRIALLLLVPVALIVVTLIGLQVWIAGYKAVDAKRAAELHQRVKGLVAQRDERASQKATNGALAFQDRASYAVLTGLAQPGKKPTPAELKAYAAEFPRLRKALARPDFLFRGEPDSAFLRGLADSLLAYAATRPPTEALGLQLAALELGARVQKQGTSKTLMVGITLQRSAVKAIMGQIRADKLRKSDYGSILEALARLELHPVTLVDRMDEDYLAFMNYTEGQVGANGFSQQVLALTPGFVERERRIYQNLYLRDRDSIEKSFALTGPPDELMKLNDEDRAFLVALSYPPYPKMRLQFARALTELSALTAMAEIGARGKIPESITQTDYLAEDGKFVYRKTGKTYSLKSGYQGTEIEPESLIFR